MSMSGFEPWSSGVESHSSVNRATVRCHKQSIWADLKTCLGHYHCDKIGRFIGLWATFKAFGNN